MKLVLPNQYESVAQVVCAHFAITEEELKSRLRTERIATVRHIIWYLLKGFDFTNMSDLARFCNRDHGTVRGGILHVADLISVDRDFAQTISFLEARCRILLEVNSKQQAH